VPYRPFWEENSFEKEVESEGGQELNKKAIMGKGYAKGFCDLC